MTYALVSIVLPLVTADPLAGIAVGGSAGVVTALLCAALLGSALNALRGRGGMPSLRDHERHTAAADRYFHHAA